MLFSEILYPTDFHFHWLFHEGTWMKMYCSVSTFLFKKKKEEEERKKI
jgi:hypothetical protein